MKKKELHVWATKDLLRIDSCRGTKKCIAERENSPPEGKLGIQERMWANKKVNMRLYPNRHNLSKTTTIKMTKEASYENKVELNDSGSIYI